VSCHQYFAANEAEELCRFCETTPCDDATGADCMPGICAWTDEDVVRIRIVLRKLTALRIRNEEDAEDLVQETLLTATANFPGYALHKGLLVWCMGVLRKKVGNYYRKMNRFTSLDDCGALAWRLCLREIRAPAPEARLRLTELQLLVERILSGFPAEERQPMQLYLAGLSTCEIAQLLYPERYQNVVNRIFRGRKKLARRLAKYGYAPPGWRGETP
jgi:RNA polymerase sigma factor (sigma-70 family)